MMDYLLQFFKLPSSPEIKHRNYLFEADGIKLQTGFYQNQPATLLIMPKEIAIKNKKSYHFLFKKVSPFWLSATALYQEDKSGVWVLQEKPEQTWESFLLSEAAQSWPLRLRVVRDIAVGLYQRRSLSLNIGWDTKLIFVDRQGRAKLLPFLHPMAISEPDEVLALASLLWQAAGCSINLNLDWQKGQGLPKQCPKDVVTLIRACTGAEAERLTLKTLAKSLDAFWQQAVSGVPEEIRETEHKSESTPVITEENKVYEMSGGLVSPTILDTEGAKTFHFTFPKDSPPTTTNNSQRTSAGFNTE